MNRSQPFDEAMASSRSDAGNVSNMAVYSSIAVFLAVFWLTVALLVF